MSYPPELNGIDRQPRVWIKTKKKKQKKGKQNKGGKKKRSVDVPVPKTLNSNLRTAL